MTTKNQKIKGITTEAAQIVGGAGRRVELTDTGNGFFLITKISDKTHPAKMVATAPMSIFLKEGEFSRA